MCRGPTRLSTTSRRWAPDNPNDPVATFGTRLVLSSTADCALTARVHRGGVPAGGELDGVGVANPRVEGRHGADSVAERGEPLGHDGGHAILDAHRCPVVGFEPPPGRVDRGLDAVSYTHLRAHKTDSY